MFGEIFGEIPGKVLESELNHVYGTDCMNILTKLPNESIDLIIADPPYYRIRGDFDFVFKSEKEYLEWCRLWIAECWRVLKTTGAFYCWGSHLMIDKLSVLVIDQYDWIKRNLIVWNYKTGRPAVAAYRTETELMWFYSKTMHRINHDEVRIAYSEGGEKDKRKNPKGKSCGNVWEFPRIMPNYKEWTGHPTQKPEKLVERIIRASSNPGDIVMIPFAGSGTEIEACIRTGRRWIAAEKEKLYIKEFIIPRIQSVV